MSACRIGLIANHGKPGAAELVREIVAECERRALPLTLEAHTAQSIGAPATCSHDDLVRTSDLLLVLGGDGTILQVLHELCDEFRPILGINLGTLGFLTCVGAAAWRDAIEAIASGTYRLSERTLLDIEVVRDGQSLGRYIALNDAVISRGELSRLIKLNVIVDEANLSEYNADGLIVATPTGSTAYSLSAGGPVLTPNSGVFVVTPICPHVLTMRPVLVSDASHIEIIPSPREPDVFLTLDGQNSVRILAGDLIRITKAPQRLPLAMLPGMSFFEVLRQKLKWSGTAI
ncbi:MAG: NAD(+)/NADH kinase [Chthoniobacter sp.]|uniref:NAD(+)/NADH kinase n=1 Tax=Chthoniobacter sp. TaxID=2510640 RepID=UPI0032A74D00